MEPRLYRPRCKYSVTWVQHGAWCTCAAEKSVAGGSTQQQHRTRWQSCKIKTLSTRTKTISLSRPCLRSTRTPCFKCTFANLLATDKQKYC